MQKRKHAVAPLQPGNGSCLPIPERFAIENICQPEPVFRPAVFTSPSELYSASELRRRRKRGAARRDLDPFDSIEYFKGEMLQCHRLHFCSRRTMSVSTCFRSRAECSVHSGQCTVPDGSKRPIRIDGSAFSRFRSTVPLTGVPGQFRKPGQGGSARAAKTARVSRGPTADAASAGTRL